MTIYEKTISYKKWRGSGYVILDPDFGTGAYLISGGANGAFVIGLYVGHAIKVATVVGDTFLDTNKPLKASFMRAIGAEFLPVIATMVLFVTAMLSAYIYTIRNDENAIGCLIAGVISGYARSNLLYSKAILKDKKSGLIGRLTTALISVLGLAAGTYRCIINPKKG